MILFYLFSCYYYYILFNVSQPFSSVLPFPRSVSFTFRCIFTWFGIMYAKYKCLNMTNKSNIALNYCNTLKYIALRHDKHTCGSLLRRQCISFSFVVVQAAQTLNPQRKRRNEWKSNEKEMSRTMKIWAIVTFQKIIRCDHSFHLCVNENIFRILDINIISSPTKKNINKNTLDGKTKRNRKYFWQFLVPQMPQLKNYDKKSISTLWQQQKIMTHSTKKYILNIVHFSFSYYI